MTYSQHGMLNLFHAYVTDGSYTTNSVNYANHALRSGVIFMNEKGDLVRGISMEVYEDCYDLYVDQANWNNTFHKSWDTVEYSSIEQLVFEQLMHYVSTYDMEAFGLRACPVIPAEEILSSCGVAGPKAFTVVRIISSATAARIVNDYLRTTLAPNKRNMHEILAVMETYASLRADEVASFELQVARHMQLNTVPSDPTTFLRFLVYKATGTSLLIKNRHTIKALKSFAARGTFTADLAKADYAALATIFHRYKPIFLALKGDRISAHAINRIRRLADTYHKPLSPMNVEHFASFIHTNNFHAAEAIAAKATGRQLIKLWNYINFQSMSEGAEGNIYNIRNGRAYFDKDFKRMNMGQYYAAMHILRKVLQAKYHGALEGKTFIIPSYIKYAAPVSEKQFLGNIPYGSSLTGPNDRAFTAAIAWDNFKGERTDIDLHMTGINGSYGWDAMYRNDDGRVLYSGDMTDAEHGAVEAYYFKPNANEKFMLSTHLYSGAPNAEFKFFLTEEPPKPIQRCHRIENLPVDVSQALFAPIPLNFTGSNSLSLGLFDGNTFVFYGGELGNSIVPKRELYQASLDTIALKLRSMTSINAIIRMAGGTIITPEEAAELSDDARAECIDLSPSAITTTTILEIVDVCETNT